MRWPAIALLTGFAAVATAADRLPPDVTGLANPAAVCFGPKNLLYVTEVGEAGKVGDGKVIVIEDGKPRTFAEGLDDPRGIVYYRDCLYVTDRSKIVKIDDRGQVSVYAPPEMFPKPPKLLNDIAIDNMAGIFLVTDFGSRNGHDGGLYWIDIRLNTITTVVDGQSAPELQSFGAVAFDGMSAAVVTDYAAGALYRVLIPQHTVAKIADGLDGANGLAWDDFGRLFISSRKTGILFAIPRPGLKPIPLTDKLTAAGDLCLDPTGQTLWVPDPKAGTVRAISKAIPGWEVNSDPLPVKLEPAFGALTWTGWDDGSESGKTNALRPVLLTNSGDGSNRIFVLIQQGVMQTFPNYEQAARTKVFLDISDRVRYSDQQNEEGLLGLAFHPKFKQNGEFFVFYTDSRAKMANVVSRFRVKANDHDVADRASEEEIIRLEKPFDNHNGGTIVFGPDGYLYIARGDGGQGGDPQENGQNPKTLPGKILRIDVDHKSAGKNYAIPADNPFAANPEAAPEIWAMGFRNPWRMAFDRKTGQLWLADVGQGMFEEIDLVTAGGNFGWNQREGLHPFGNKPSGPRPGVTEPIWEYHHNQGVSITGGLVYRGSAIPELQGAYVYGDYVSNRVWALRYDAKQRRVVANQPLPGPGIGIMSFGEDEKGELYVMGSTANGRGIFRYVKADK